MTGAIRAAFRNQAESCAALGSPFTARLLRHLADGLHPGSVVADRVLGWTGDPSAVADSVALRLAGGLHAVVLAGKDPALQAMYHSAQVDDGVLMAALLRHDGQLLQWLDNPPQTNEVRRSALLIAVGQWLAARFGLPLVLSELGASAGLNLIWDRYALLAGGKAYGKVTSPVQLTPDWRGVLPPDAAPLVAARAGVDLNPLHPVADRLRLLSYIWPDQADRLLRTKRALALAADMPPLTRGDAVDWLQHRLGMSFPGHLHLIFHTVAWQYFPKSAQARGAALFDAAGARATDDAPLARFAMEADGAAPGAALTLTIWPAGEAIVLGRADFHGRWVDWTAPAP